jgi:hypothetical protein
MDGNCKAPVDHLSFWNHIFSVLPSGFTTLVLLFIAITSINFWFVCHGIGELNKYLLLEPLYTPRPSLLPRNYLQEAFSNGILNPKLH